MTKFITNEDYTESSQKFPRHVKHTATAWPNLIFFLFTTRKKSEKGQNLKLVAQTVPNRIFSFPSRNLVAQDEISQRTALSVLDRFFLFFFLSPATSWHRAKFPDTPLFRSSTDFSFFFTPPRGTEQTSSTHYSNGPHNYVARQTKPNTTVRPQWTLTKASRPTPFSRDKQEK